MYCDDFKIHDMEAEFANVQRGNLETLKELSHSERRSKELQFQSEEDKKTQQRLQRSRQMLKGVKIFVQRTLLNLLLLLLPNLYMTRMGECRVNY